MATDDLVGFLRVSLSPDILMDNLLMFLEGSYGFFTRDPEISRNVPGTLVV